MTSQDPNSSTQDLVRKIQQFFSYQIECNSELSDASKESLTVALECIEQAYNLQKAPASNELADMYRRDSQREEAPPSSASNNNPTQGNVPDPSALLNNVIGNVFSQVFGQASPVLQPQRQDTPQTQADVPTRATNAPNQTSQPKQRKNATEAEKIAADSFKNQGNDLVKQDRYQEAYDSYSKAIEIDNNNAIYYSNRAAASLKLGNHENALRDCQEAIEIDPNYYKAYSRMGHAYASLQNHQKARDAYAKAVELDPTNETYRENLRAAEEQLAAQASRSGAQQQQQPQHQSNMMGVFASMMSNPEVISMAMRSLQDPRVQNLVGMATGGLTGQQQAPQQQQSPPPPPPPPQQQQQQTTAASENRQAATEASNQEQHSSPIQPSLEQQPPPSAPPTGGPFNPADLFGNGARGGNAPNIDFVGSAQQMFAAMQSNTEVMNNMRRMMGQIFNPQQNPNQDNDRNPPPGYS